MGEAIAAEEAAWAKKKAARQFSNDIKALHRRAENEKTVLLLELDKQRKMLNDERFVNREKLDRRTFELFELKTKTREMFKEEWVAFEKREKDRWAALNARQAANDELEMSLRKQEVAIEADEDIVHMKQLKQEKELRESLKASLQGARMQVRNALMKKKQDLTDQIKLRQKAAKELQKQLELEEMLLVKKEEEQKKREAAHSVFLTPRIQITPEDQPELTIKPWKNGANGKSESQEGGVHSQSQN